MICRFNSFVFACLLASATASPFAPAQSKNDGKAKYMNKLMKKATPTENSQLRRLEQVEMDLTPYSLKFMQCQFVKAYDDEMADDQEAGTILGTQRFVTFRLCSDSDCDSCNYNFGEYMVDLETYLEATVQYYEQQQEEMCQACDECGNNNQQQQEDQAEEENDGGRRLAVDCDSCYAECQKYENLEDYGLVDAAEFLQCGEVDMGGDDDGNNYFVGPICSDNGSEIKIGVFKDDTCSTFAHDGTDIDDVIQAMFADENDANAVIPQLSYHTLGNVGSNTCISCLVVDEDADANDEPEAQEVCQQLYEEAGKCETPYGFEGVLSFGYEEYYNQVAQEDTVCTFIKNVNGGAYDEEGEISISSSSVTRGSGTSTVTGWQKFLLTFFVLGTVGLVAFAAALHSSLTKGAKADLSSKGGAMA